MHDIVETVRAREKSASLARRDGESILDLGEVYRDHVYHQLVYTVRINLIHELAQGLNLYIINLHVSKYGIVQP